ncbi:biorientation of chromosomes in cell division protein 1-like [Chelonia mydas]|uniref:biorientation of chromosomes in cell division protein 1-like n=1 Tax=Chelonia mydas TaxID=8469 RepID=UPI001CA93B56|nr:biorientation of chromosomes in cell division protein 1-like [Chelonia mydas]
MHQCQNLRIEKAIHEFLAAQKKEETVPALPPEPENQDPPAPSQDASQRQLVNSRLVTEPLDQSVFAASQLHAGDTT